MIRICADCGRLIEGERFTSYTPDRPTTAAPTVYWHAPRCPDPDDPYDPFRDTAPIRR
jgi:hypothetical protein